MPTDRKKILITGAAGFVFGNFIRCAIFDKQPWSIVGVDRINSSIDLNNVYRNKNTTLHIADTDDSHVFSRIVEYEQPDVVIHGTGSIGDSFSVGNACEAHKVKKLIYISDGSIYGGQKSELEQPSKESDELQYLHNEEIPDNGLDINIIRLSNNYGARQSPKKLIPSIIKSVQEGTKIQLHSKGEYIRDWMHVRDTYAGICAVMDKGVPGEIYNLGAGQEFSTLEVAQLVCKAMKAEMNLEFVDHKSDFRRAMSTEKIRSLGWEPKIRFREGIEDTVNWFTNNKYWLKE